MKIIDTLTSIHSSIGYNRLNRIISPLNTAFGIDIFWWHKISSDGQFQLVSNRPDILSYYYGNHFYKYNPFMRTPKNYTNGAIFPLIGAQEKYRETQENTNEKYGMNHLFYVLTKDKGDCYLYGFVSTKKEIQLQNIYINNFSTFNKFTNYFENEWTGKIKNPDKFSIHLPELMGDHYYSIDQSIQIKNEKANAQFLKLIGLHSYPTNPSEVLSKREQDCIKYLIMGYSANKTSIALGISRRTVETYFENIKNKLGCYSKQELHRIASEWNRKGLF